jgi:hypothetical protein
MNTIRARYEVGIEDVSLEHFRLWSDASTRAVAINGYVFDRMALVGKAQLWQTVNGDLIVQSVRLPNNACNRPASAVGMQGESLESADCSIESE